MCQSNTTCIIVTSLFNLTPKGMLDNACRGFVQAAHGAMGAMGAAGDAHTHTFLPQSVTVILLQKAGV